MKNNNLIWIISIGFVALGGILYMIFKPKKETVQTDTEGGTNEAAPPAPGLCFIRKKETDTSYFAIDENQVNDWHYAMKGKGYTADFIRNAMAFFKGMDLSISSKPNDVLYDVILYDKEIRRFMKDNKKPLFRSTKPLDELTGQPFSPGDLACQTNTFTQNYLWKRPKTLKVNPY
jgi:hypothetical protein